MQSESARINARHEYRHAVEADYGLFDLRRVDEPLQSLDADGVEILFGFADFFGSDEIALVVFGSEASLCGRFERAVDLAENAENAVRFHVSYDQT